MADPAGDLIARHLHADDPALPGSDLPGFRRVYVNSHVRTRQWFKQGQAFVWDGAGGTASYRQPAAWCSPSQPPMRR
jgi:DNA (cytosine-5)-methyltransferase 1